MPKNGKRRVFLVIIASLVVKSALFIYASTYFPSYKFMPDTPTYIEPGVNLVEKGTFATFDENGEIEYEMNRTPGYPLFIAILNRVLGISMDGIIFVQILLITLAGYITYKAACELDRNIALLAAFIFLFDLPVTVSSLHLLSGAVYTVFMALFMYLFLKYLTGRRIGFLVSSILILVIATYIRPVSYYLGFCLAGGVFFFLLRINLRKAVAHALILLLIFYSSVWMWEYRNYVRTGNMDFTTVDDMDLHNMGLTRKYAREGGFEKTGIGPVRFYIDRTARSVFQFFTVTGTLKYLGSVPIKIASKVYGYPWVVFWLAGLPFAGYKKLPFLFLFLTVLYFMLVSVTATGLVMGSRFRVPVMPFLSILSASGWVNIAAMFKRQ